MQVTFHHGVSVHRRVGTDCNSELLAVFRYLDEARAYVKLMVARDEKNKWESSTYIICDHHSASLTFHFVGQNIEED